MSYPILFIGILLGLAIPVAFIAGWIVGIWNATDAIDKLNAKIAEMEKPK